MKKKLLGVLIAVLMITASAFVFVGCRNNNMSFNTNAAIAALEEAGFTTSEVSAVGIRTITALRTSDGATAGISDNIGSSMAREMADSAYTTFRGLYTVVVRRGNVVLGASSQAVMDIMLGGTVPGPGPENGIPADLVGSWEISHVGEFGTERDVMTLNADGTVDIRFYLDGDLELEVSGSFSISGSSITMTIMGETETASFSISGNMLTLTYDFDGIIETTVFSRYDGTAPGPGNGAATTIAEARTRVSALSGVTLTDNISTPGAGVAFSAMRGMSIAVVTLWESDMLAQISADMGATRIGRITVWNMAASGGAFQTEVANAISG